MTEFDNWNSKQKRIVPSNTGRFHTLVDSERKRAWRAALKMVSKLCPTNEKATFANQGQGMDGYTELANYKAMYKKLKEELDAKT